MLVTLPGWSDALRGPLLGSAVLLGAAVVACAPEPVSDGGAAVAAEAEAAFRNFVRAWEEQDLEAAVGAFSPDAVAFEPAPPTKFEGTEGIRAWTSGAFDALDRISIATEDVRARAEGPVAWVTARYTFEGEQEGEAVRDEGYVSMVWVREADGAYRARLFHASVIP